MAEINSKGVKWEVTDDNGWRTLLTPGDLTEDDFGIGDIDYSSSGTSITGNDNTRKILYRAAKHEFGGDIKFSTVQDLVDNTAAIAAGLQVGEIYRTGDLLKIVH